MSDLETLLELVARECSETTADYDDILPKLKRRLLPLLEAGDNMYYEEYGEADATIGSFRDWRVAKKLAMEGR